MASGWGNSWGASWGGSWGSINSAPDPGHYIGGAMGGGGTGIDYQVPRRAHPRVNKEAERFADIAELELIIKTLIGPTASYKMMYDTDKIIAPFSEVEHPEVDEVYIEALAEDKEAVAALMEVWKRYNEKRKELFTKLRDADYDWEEK